MLAMSPVAGRIGRRVGPKPLLVIGTVVIAVAYTVAVLVDLNVSLVLAINTFIGVDIGLGYAAMPTLILQAVPVSETAAASGLNTLMRALGTSIAAAAVAAVLANSAVATPTSSIPSESGFQLARIFGLCTAAICTILAAVIPSPRPVVNEEPALPEGVAVP